MRSVDQQTCANNQHNMDDAYLHMREIYAPLGKVD